MRRGTKLLLVGAFVLIAAAAGLGWSDGASSARLLHVEPSEFAPVVVFEQYGERCMNFTEIEGEGRQTCFQLNDPDKMVFEYTRMMTSALFVKPNPESILIIGLGGATLPVALHKILPEARIDTVELDPAVVRVAQTYFGYEAGPRQRVFVEDGRAFIERAHREGRQYDMVMLDAFDADYIPAHLLTIEFLRHVRAILAPEGLVISNSFAQSRMYARESATYTAVFGKYFNLRAGIEGNRVIIASVQALPDEAALKRNAKALAGALQPFNIDVEAALGRFRLTDGRYDEADVLHDPR